MAWRCFSTAMATTTIGHPVPFTMPGSHGTMASVLPSTEDQGATVMRSISRPVSAKRTTQDGRYSWKRGDRMNIGLSPDLAKHPNKAWPDFSTWREKTPTRSCRPRPDFGRPTEPWLLASREACLSIADSTLDAAVDWNGDSKRQPSNGIVMR